MMTPEQSRATIVGRIVTAFASRYGEAEARRLAEWVVNGYPWPGDSDETTTSAKDEVAEAITDMVLREIHRRKQRGLA